MGSEGEELAPRESALPLRRFFDLDLGELVQRFFGGYLSASFDIGFGPPRATYEPGETGYTVTWKVPGFDKGDLGVEVDQSGVYLTASQRGGGRHQYAAQMLGFPRPILPEAKASFSDGVLTVEVPYGEEPDTGRKTVDID